MVETGPDPVEMGADLGGKYGLGFILPNNIFIEIVTEFLRLDVEINERGFFPCRCFCRDLAVYLQPYFFER